mmetsp:Transcript_19829/g.55138  ORF Transcript_19829/g.55138 Transcript_19829/m.55138 type:complete len:266 (+) Transcript_19829:90-887(+)
MAATPPKIKKRAPLRVAAAALLPPGPLPLLWPRRLIPLLLLLVLATRRQLGALAGGAGILGPARLHVPADAHPRLCIAVTGGLHLQFFLAAIQCLPDIVKLVLDGLPNDVVDGVAGVEVVDGHAVGLADSVCSVLRLHKVPRRPGELRHHHQARSRKSQSLAGSPQAQHSCLVTAVLLESCHKPLSLVGCRLPINANELHLPPPQALLNTVQQALVVCKDEELGVGLQKVRHVLLHGLDLCCGRLGVQLVQQSLLLHLGPTHISA